MSTKGALVTAIEGDIGRTDLTTLIGTEITSIIEKELQHRVFWFNTTRDFVFALVSGTYKYTSTTTDTIGSQTVTVADFWDIRNVWFEPTGRKRQLTHVDIDVMTQNYDGSEPSGDPYQWSWYDETLYLYPKPNTTDNIRIVGHFNIAAPATDGEADNPWMLYAYEYIREKVKYKLYQSRINNEKRLALATAGVKEHMRYLEERTARKQQNRPIEGSEMPC